MILNKLLLMISAGCRDGPCLALLVSLGELRGQVWPRCITNRTFQLSLKLPANLDNAELA